jgi:hypothetical protein
MNTPTNKPKSGHEIEWAKRQALARTKMPTAWDFEAIREQRRGREEAIPRFNHDLAEDESRAFHRVDLSLWDSKKMTETI